VAVSDETDYSPVARRSLHFAPQVSAGAIAANDTPCDTWAEAVALINEAGGGTITLSGDVELSEEEAAALPSVPCVITAEGEFTLTSLAGPLLLQGDLILRDIHLNTAEIYANGYNLTVETGVTAEYSLRGTAVYGGRPASVLEGEQPEISGDPLITIESGAFTVYAGGGINTILHGSPEIRAAETAGVDIVGATVGTVITGDVKVYVVGDDVTLYGFVGEENGGLIAGGLGLIIKGTPRLDPHGAYLGSVNRDFGVVRLYEFQEDTAIFTAFEEVIIESEDPDPNDPDPNDPDPNDPDPNDPDPNDPDPNDPEPAPNTALLTADEEYVRLPDLPAFTFTANVNEEDEVNLLHTIFAYDADRFTASYDLLVDDHLLQSVYVKEEEGLMSVIIGSLGATDKLAFEDTALLKIRLTPLDAENGGQAELRQSSMYLYSASDGTGKEVPVEWSPEPVIVNYAPPAAGTHMDVNRDGQFDGADLSLALYYYGFSPDDPEWEDAAVYADINEDLRVDMADIEMLIQQIHAVNTEGD
jgi:hypothetical protein